MTSLGSAPYSSQVPVSSVRLDINWCPLPLGSTCCANVREEHAKYREELDHLYNDYKALDQQNEVLRERNISLERRCEEAEALTGSWKNSLKAFQESLSDLLFSGLKRVSTETQTDDISDNGIETEPEKSEDSNITEDSAFVEMRAENHRLRVRFEQAIMLAAEWESRWRSSEGKKQNLEQKLAVLSREHLDESMERNWTMGIETDEEKNETISPRFHQEVSRNRECQKCRLFIDEDDIHRDLCRFHTQRPLVMSEWLNLFPEVENIAAYRGYKYWRCCDRLSRKCPIGCTVGYHVLSRTEERDW